MRDLMIDLETLGTAFNAPVLAIGAVKFDIDTGVQGETFYAKIDPADAMNYGRMSGDTFAWWMRQGDEARREAVAGRSTAREAFELFRHFVSGPGIAQLRPWGNGSIFDLGILDVAFPRILDGRTPPWKFWNIRDVRTVKDLGETAGFTFTGERKGTHHTALADAQFQAEYTSFYWRSLTQRAAAAPAPQATPAAASSDVLSDLLGI